VKRGWCYQYTILFFVTNFLGNRELVIMGKKQINIFLWIFIFFIASSLFYYFIIYNRSSSVDNKDITYVRAKVLEVISSNLTEEGNIPGVYIGTQELKIEILSGEFKGQRLTLTNSRLHGDLVYDVVITFSWDRYLCSRQSSLYTYFSIYLCINCGRKNKRSNGFNFSGYYRIINSFFYVTINV
jgi:hypothetical protein